MGATRLGVESNSAHIVKTDGFIHCSQYRLN